MFSCLCKTACYVVLVTFLFCSCDKVRIQGATDTLKKFETAYKSEDLAAVLECFPEFTALDGMVRKVDELVITSAEVTENGEVEMKVKSNWTNPVGKLFSYDVTFYFRPIKREGKDVYVIKNTKNFLSYSDSYLYLYSLKREPNILSACDLEKSKVMMSYKEDFGRAIATASKTISENLQISNFHWSSGYYSDNASGSAVVKNNTGINLPRICYQVTYYDRKDNVVTQDRGVVSYSGLAVGQMDSFSFFTSTVGNARSARVDCYVDDQDFLMQVASQM